MATRSYFIPGWGYINEVKLNSFFTPGWGYINETSTGPTPPPPTNDPYVIGTGMVKQGTSILLQGTTPLINKGTVRDALNIIPH